ncbi:MAG: hypothetical protein LBU12_08545 [Deltaproteobacteria bacterium]|jgi:hypothetical protein|nr:hypothetical protein [Deltaproteobacteria bacterium]
MIHRNIDGESYSMMSIEDFIVNGKLDDWIELRNYIKNNKFIIEKIKLICDLNDYELHSQFYRFWKKYVEQTK